MGDGEGQQRFEGRARQHPVRWVELRCLGVEGDHRAPPRSDRTDVRVDSATKPQAATHQQAPRVKDQEAADREERICQGVIWKVCAKTGEVQGGFVGAQRGNRGAGGAPASWNDGAQVIVGDADVLGMTHFINLTPHAVTLRTETGNRTFHASGQVARVSIDLAGSGFIDGIPCSTRKCGPVTGLPPCLVDLDTYYIVSTMVFDAFTAHVSGLREDAALNPAVLPYFEAAALVLDHLLVPDSGPDAIRSAGPSGRVTDAILKLRRNAEWAAQGLPCDSDLALAVDAVVQELAAMPGQIVAVRRFICS